MGIKVPLWINDVQLNLAMAYKLCG